MLTLHLSNYQLVPKTEFEAIIDLVEMKCFKYTNDLGTEIDEIEILKITKRTEEARSNLIEAVAETNDELMEKYLGDEEISVAELKMLFVKQLLT